MQNVDWQRSDWWPPWRAPTLPLCWRRDVHDAEVDLDDVPVPTRWVRWHVDEAVSGATVAWVSMHSEYRASVRYRVDAFGLSWYLPTLWACAQALLHMCDRANQAAYEKYLDGIAKDAAARLAAMPDR